MRVFQNVRKLFDVSYLYYLRQCPNESQNRDRSAGQTSVNHMIVTISCFSRNDFFGIDKTYNGLETAVETRENFDETKDFNVCV